MDKVEKFISDCTRNCSNVFVNPKLGGTEENAPWLTPDQARKAVEIAREEVFEKIKFYIESMVSDITFSDINGNDNYDLNEFIEDIKQVVKNE